MNVNAATRLAGFAAAVALGLAFASGTATAGPEGGVARPPDARAPHGGPVDGRGPHDGRGRPHVGRGSHDGRGSSPHDGHGPHDRGAHDHHGLLEKHAERLGLDERTRAAVADAIEKSREAGEALRAKIDDARDEMRKLLAAEDVEESAVMRQAETIGSLEIEEHKNRLRAMLRIRSLLTPEQRKKLVEIRDEMFAGIFERTRPACAADIERLCPDARVAAAQRECMRSRRHEISAPCRDAIAAELAKHRREP